MNTSDWQPSEARSDHRCRGCGAAVTADYVRVRGTRGDGDVDACPHCPNMTRDAEGKPRPTRNTKQVEVDA
jgi:hypothetical protein